jgi:hypothetical protein
MLNQTFSKLLVVFLGMCSILMITCTFVPFGMNQGLSNHFLVIQQSQQTQSSCKVDFFGSPTFLKGLPKLEATKMNITNGLNVVSTQDAPSWQGLVDSIGWNRKFDGTPAFSFFKSSCMFLAVVGYITFMWLEGDVTTQPNNGKTRFSSKINVTCPFVLQSFLSQTQHGLDNSNIIPVWIM